MILSILRKINLKVVIFTLVGIFNTLLDLVVYIIFFEKTSSIIVSNLIATSIAMISSYLLNSRLTFKNEKWSLRQLLIFLIIKAFGLWVLQTGLIYLLTPLFKLVPVSFWNFFGSVGRIFKIALPKIVAITASFMWNFIWYDKFVFKNSKQTEAEKIVSSLE
jgi:putative flippase GtrA